MYHLCVRGGRAPFCFKNLTPSIFTHSTAPTHHETPSSRCQTNGLVTGCRTVTGLGCVGVVAAETCGVFRTFCSGQKKSQMGMGLRTSRRDMSTASAGPARACQTRRAPCNLPITARGIVTLQFVRLRASRMAPAGSRSGPVKNTGAPTPGPVDALPLVFVPRRAEPVHFVKLYFANWSKSIRVHKTRSYIHSNVGR